MGVPRFKVTGPKGGTVAPRATAPRLSRLLPGWLKRYGRVAVTPATSKASRPVLTQRQRVVEFLRWGIASASQIGYAEVRPIPTAVPGVLPKLPFTTDCSGDVTMAYQYAGAKNPNRADGIYDGAGYTGTLLAHGKRVKLADVRIGDLAVFGCKTYPTGHHVCGVTAVTGKALSGIVLSSHGSQVGPLEITAAEEAKYQPDGIHGIVFLSFLP